MSDLTANRAGRDAPALAFGLDFDTLVSDAGPGLVDAQFLIWLQDHDQALADRITALRQASGSAGASRTEAELLLGLARALDPFVAHLFGIETEWSALIERHRAIDPVLRTKYKFVKRQALLGVEPEARDRVDAAALRAQLQSLGADPDNEQAFAAHVQAWQVSAKSADEPLRAEARAALAVARDYAAWAAGTAAGRRRHPRSVLFRHPQSLQPDARIEHLITQSEAPGFPMSGAMTSPITIHRIHPQARHRRDGFALTDPGTDLAGALDEARYCLKCHATGKDSCSHGLLASGSRPEGSHANARETRFLRAPTGEALGGCPLEERISEFLQLKSEAVPIGALAMITLDNPMVAATGHRICNDCMKSCIFQQQTPVDIPQAETRVLRDVLELPWGFEIYALLVRWNPLSIRRPVPEPATGKRVLVVGAGPAGFALAHHLLNDGHGVVLIDGLKIEPGADPAQAVRDIGQWREPLDTRIGGGFGGVAEYGITVRWDKNFLSMLRLLLERRSRFALFGGVRFGGTLTTDDAFDAGFDHVALSTGAGRPTLTGIANELAPGVRAASDFLMALQLTGAARDDSIANLQMRLPVLVVGGGLTAMDTACESMAYYVKQVEKFRARHEALVARHGQDRVQTDWSEQEALVAREFLAHAEAIAQARQAAARDGTEPDLTALVQSWGGATVVYRKALTQSPAYRLNPEEVASALAEGIAIADELQPLAIATDRFGACAGLTVRTAAGGELTLPARSVFVAAGTSPNAMIAEEEPQHFALRGASFAAITPDGEPAITGARPKPENPSFFCSRHADGRLVSFLGDTHPAYAGNVVSALASAKAAAPSISGALRARAPAIDAAWPDFLAARADDFNATVAGVERLAPGIVEVRVRAPAAARAFRPGQFYRLQNFERRAQRIASATGNTRLGMEGLAMTGAWVDRDAGIVGLIVLEMGGSSDLCALLAPDEPVVLMGPTGMPTEIGTNETIALVGGGLGNAVLFSIGAAMRAAGSKVVYFAAYRKRQDRFRSADIEAAADQVIWCCDEAPGFEPERPQDLRFTGNVVDAIAAMGDRLVVDTLAIDRLVAIGSDRMMAAVASACQGTLAARFKPDIKLIASINSPMQCMMKAICAQCLQRQVDPVTGEASVVFSCATQDQSMRHVDFACLADRLSLNSLAEKQTSQWLRDTMASSTMPSGQ